MTTDELRFVSQRPVSKWRCYLFGGGESGLVWRPNEGDEPNWFWRWMQYLAFGNRWVHDDDGD